MRCLQLHRTCTSEDLAEFLEEHAGKVRRVKQEGMGRGKRIGEGLLETKEQNKTQTLLFLLIYLVILIVIDSFI